MATKQENIEDTTRVLTLLKKKQRASATDLGTNKKVMDFLAEKGFVHTDGKIKRKAKGKPPTAYVPAFDYNPAEAPRLRNGAPQAAGPKVATQAQIDQAIREVSASTIRDNCSCIVKMGPGTTQEEIRALGIGCTAKDHGRWVCPSLDAVRRRAKL